MKIAMLLAPPVLATAYGVLIPLCLLITLSVLTLLDLTTKTLLNHRPRAGDPKPG